MLARTIKVSIRSKSYEIVVVVTATMILLLRQLCLLQMMALLAVTALSKTVLGPDKTETPGVAAHRNQDLLHFVEAPSGTDGLGTEL